MENRPVLMVVGTRLHAPEQREAFNKWYDEYHIPLFLKVPGFIRADRYERFDPERKEGGLEYLAIYQVANEASVRGMWDAPERRRATEQRIEVWGDPPRVYEVTFHKYYRPLGA